MRQSLRVALASYGPEQFRVLDDTITASGHIPVVCLVSRALRPFESPEPSIAAAISHIIDELPRGMDLLLPGSAKTVESQLTGYQVDLLIVFGFNWRLPPATPRSIGPAPTPTQIAANRMGR